MAKAVLFGLLFSLTSMASQIHMGGVDSDFESMKNVTSGQIAKISLSIAKKNGLKEPTLVVEGSNNTRCEINAITAKSAGITLGELAQLLKTGYSISCVNIESRRLSWSLVDVSVDVSAGSFGYGSF